MEKGKALGLGYLKGVYFCFLMAVVKESNGESVTLPTNNVVYFDQEVKEVFQENIYISCRESEAVMFIPLAQLHQFPAVKGCLWQNSLTDTILIKVITSASPHRCFFSSSCTTPLQRALLLLDFEIWRFS